MNAQQALIGNRRAVSRMFSRSGCKTGFSLMEVMIAVAIFFMCIFVILGVVSASLRNARLLRRIAPDAGMVAAQLSVALTSTNQVFEGVESGDFGDMYPDYSWTYDLYEVATNGFCQVDIIVQQHSSGQPVSQMSINLFLPKLQKGSFGPH